MRSRTGLWIGVVMLGGCVAPDESEPATTEIEQDSNGHGNHDDCNWPQWGSDPGHTGQACKGTRHFDRIAAHRTFDPFTEEEKADALAIQGAPALFTHYQSPLLVGNDVYMEFKSGDYTSCTEDPVNCGPFGWNSQVWTEKKMHWQGGQLVEDWTFASDWKPEPGQFAFWEPVFHAVVSGNFLYVPGRAGGVHKLDRHTGRKLATIALPGGDDQTYVAGGLAADNHGNIYYNALALDATNPFLPPRGAWLVKVSANNTVKTAAFATIAVGAPAADALCLGQFTAAQRPWPPSPDAVPPSFPCGPQRPPLNVTPAIRADGMVVTISTAHNARRYMSVVAVNSDLSPKWNTSLRDFLNDGCGVTVPINAPPGTTDPALLGNCRIGATPGVEPATNQRPAGFASDQASSSPVILPDGGVLFGAFTAYNGFRGHTFKLDKHGQKVASYDFGWDLTPAIYRHDGTYSIIIKDNHYIEQDFYMSQLDSNLQLEWSYKGTNPLNCHRNPDNTVVCVDDGQHPKGYEWCVNAPAVDRDGNVYANSEDGWVYKIGQGGVEKDRMFLLESLGAAYTPISLDHKGRLYSLNGGDLFVIEANHGHGHDH
jgi:hypothetical protein